MQNPLFGQKKARVGGVTISSPILIGAGVIKDPLASELDAYLNKIGIVGAVTIGSITPDARRGNSGVLNWPKVIGEYKTYAIEGGLHANGMRNLGITETMKNLPKNSAKPIIISVAGYSTEDYVGALQTIVGHENASEIKAIEVNCSCPTMGCAPLAYSLEALEELFVEVKKMQLVKPLWFKLSPYFTEADITALSEEHPKYDFAACPTVTVEFMVGLQKLLKDYTGIMSAVIVSNGLPQVARSSEINVEKPGGETSTVAGLSGSILKAGNLKTIAFMKEHVLTVDIIGCGGVLSREDVADYLEAGATAVQCSGGPIWGGGVEFFNSLTN